MQRKPERKIIDDFQEDQVKKEYLDVLGGDESRILEIERIDKDHMMVKSKYGSTWSVFRDRNALRKQLSILQGVNEFMEQGHEEITKSGYIITYFKFMGRCKHG